MGAEVADLYVTLRSITAPFTAGLAEAGGAASDFIAQLAAITAAATEAGASLTAVGTDGAAAGTEAAAGMDRTAVAADGAAAATERATVATKASSKAAEESAASTDLLNSKVLGLGGVLQSVSKWGALGIVGIGAAAVDLGAKFQTQMTRLTTAAGAPLAQVGAIKNQVLDLGTQTGYTGTQIAEALYHPVSAGLSLAASLQAVKYAAEESKISGASLDDTTYSLSSVMKAFNMSASDAGPTMSQLNAIVGEGDMRFQDFNESIKNWAPTAAQMGMSVQSMGAGLAYLTDRGNSAEVAATRMTMGISMMTTPSKQAGQLLEAMGVASSDVKSSSDAMTEAMQKSHITQNQLASDLQKPDGLYVALNHLKTALQATGVTGTESDSIMAKIFGGGRSDKAIMSLIQNLGGVQDKYNAIVADSTPQKFAAAWEQTQKTISFQFDQIKAAAENAGIHLGEALIPKVSSFITLLESRGKPVIKDFTTALSGIEQGFTGKTAKPTEGAATTGKGGEQHGAVIAAPPPLTPMQELGKVLKSVADDIDKFIDSGHHLADVLLKEIIPQVEKIGGGAIVGGLQLVGGILANVVAPAMNGLADFATKHKEIMTWIIDGFLIPLTIRLGLLATVKTVSAVAGLAKDIITFPFSQGKQVLDQLGSIKDKLFGAADKTDADGNVVQGAKGLFQKLGDVFSKGWSGLKSAGSATGDLFSGAYTATKSQLQIFGLAFKDAGSKIASTVGGWGSSIGAAVKNIMPTKLDAQMFLQSVKDVGSNVASTVSGWGSTIGTAVSGWASSAVSAAKGVGSSIATGLSNGLSTLGAQTKAVWQGLGSAVSAAGTAAQGAVEWLVASGKAAYEAGVKAAAAAISWIAEKVATLATAVADGIMMAAQWALDAALDANPIGLIIIAILALAAALVYAWNHCATFRILVEATFDAIKDAALFLWHNVFDPAFHGIADAAMWLWHNAIDPAFQNIKGSIKTAMDFISGIPGDVMGFFKDAGSWLSNAGSKIISGLVSGIKSAIGDVKNTLGGLTNDITSWKGPPERDAKLLTPAGESLITGLIQGITNKVPALKSQLGAITDHIGSMSPTMTANLAVAGGGSVGAGSYGQLAATPATSGGAPTVVVNVTVQGSVLSENDLRDVMERQMYRLGMRNSTTWQQYARR